PTRIKDVAGASQILCDILRTALSISRVARIAMVCNLGETHGSDESASQRLSELTGGIWFPTPPLDAIYQFNRRRPYKCEARHTMNRVVSWSAGSLQLVRGEFSSFGTTALSIMNRVFPIVAW